MVEPLPEDSAYILSMIRRHPGVNGRVIMIETGFEHDHCIDAIKVLVLEGLAYLKFDNPEDWFRPRFEICRFFPRI